MTYKVRNRNLSPFCFLSYLMSRYYLSIVWFIKVLIFATIFEVALVSGCGGWEQVHAGDSVVVGPLADDEVIGGVKSIYYSRYYDRVFYVRICRISSTGQSD